MTDPMRSAVAESVHVPLLIVLGGLPGTGKTTIARGLARDLSAVHVRIDSIEEALRRTGLVRPDAVVEGAEATAAEETASPPPAAAAPLDLRDAGYRIAYAVALDNLQAGHWVIADAVNPIALTREAWRAVGEAARSPVVEIEVICSDPAVLRARIEGRTADIPGFQLPTWDDVLRRRYDTWEPEPGRVDTARTPPDVAVRQALTAIMRAQAAG